MKLGIVSPSAPSTHTDERTGQFEAGLRVLRELGFDYELSEHARSSLSYISDTTENRVADIHGFYLDESINAILAANGGWNSGHLLKLLDFDLIRNNPKPLIGYSDISVLLNALYKETGLLQVHGPMATWGFYENNEFTNNSFKKILRGEDQILGMEEFGVFIKGNEMSGVLIGGNLVSISTLLGTSFMPDWKEKIFFWEETEEDIQSLDRAITHFENAGIWEEIGGMIIGKLDEIEEEFSGKRTDSWELIEERFSKYNFPILKTELFGHGILKQLSLPIGGKIVANKEKVKISSK